MEHYPGKLVDYEKNKKIWERGGKKGNPPKAPKKPFRRMHNDEPRNFLRFATALKILVGSSITRDGLQRAKGLLRDYLLKFSEVLTFVQLQVIFDQVFPQLYGIGELKPNHHWAVHIPDQVEDYGPLYSFWTFLTERLNKVLKNLNSNNWSGGLLEVSMMREFHRMAQLDGMVRRVQYTIPMAEHIYNKRSPALRASSHFINKRCLSANRRRVRAAYKWRYG
jgi:hypothetical protein